MVGRIGRIVATAGAVAAAMVDVVHPRKEEMVRHHPMYGRTLTQEDWPTLSDMILRARKLQLGERMVCLIEGEEDIRAKESAFWDLGGDVFQLTFRTKRRDALYFPKSLLAEGRNYLFAAAAAWELQLGQRYLYYILMDADAEVDDWSIGWRDFRKFLLDWQPAVGLPELFDYHQILYEYQVTDESEVRTVLNFDHTVVAVHSDATIWLLPYVTNLDEFCQWVSQWRFSSLANALFPQHTVLTHQLSVKNPHHASYSKSRCLDLMLNVTEELRAAEPVEFHSCFVEPSNQALIVDGLPRLTAYLPWFSPLKRRPQQNYSHRPRLQSCDNQQVVQALAQSSKEDDDSHSYSWCRGCHISVAFAVLQTIVVTRPFVFTGWLKLSNILALAAAQREDLVVSHVAFVVASRLLWCAEGIRGAEINVEELTQFWEGHEQHGILLARSSETLQEIEDSVLRLGDRVIYNAVRAALSPFEERVPAGQASMISDETVEMLVNIMRHCEEPGKYFVLLKDDA